MNTPVVKSHTPVLQIVQKDGAGWYEEVGRVHDNRHFDNDKRYRVELMKGRIDKLINVTRDMERVRLLRSLQIAIVRHESCLKQAEELVGVRPSEGLFDKIKHIVDKAPPWRDPHAPRPTFMELINLRHHFKSVHKNQNRL